MLAVSKGPALVVVRINQRISLEAIELAEAGRREAVGPLRARQPGPCEDDRVAKLTATLHTTAGDIVVTLFPDQAPVTVRNFVSLAEGSKEWRNPATGQKSNEPLYNGTIFHRVIDGFMIQGGDPLG